MLQALYANTGLMYFLISVSVISFIGSLIIIPWLIIRLPEGYFVGTERRLSKTKNQHPAVYLSAKIAKNIIGALLVILGLIMLLLPGQGILTILIGLSLMDFPGKYAFERFLLSRTTVTKSINWIRRKAKKTPLVFK
jgi:hypothetical protein